MLSYEYIINTIPAPDQFELKKVVTPTNAVPNADPNINEVTLTIPATEVKAGWIVKQSTSGATGKIKTDAYAQLCIDPSAIALAYRRCPRRRKSQTSSTGSVLSAAEDNTVLSITLKCLKGPIRKTA